MHQQRPKSAVRRRTVERDEIGIGVGSFIDDETDMDELTSGDSDEADDDDESVILDHEIEFHDFDEDKALQKKAISLKFFDQEIQFTNVEDHVSHTAKGSPVHPNSSQTSVNQEGVHELFSDILFTHDPVEIVNLEGSNTHVKGTSSESETDDDPPNEVQQYEGLSKSFAQSLHESQLRMLRRNTDAQISNLHRPQNLVLAYPELQRASGLKVLRRIFERKKSLEINQQEVKNSTSSERKDLLSPKDFEQFRKKPPSRLKPLSACSSLSSK